MMKHQYEIMRIMLTKVLDSRELLESMKSVLYIRDAIRYRVDDLISLSALLSSAPFAR